MSACALTVWFGLWSNSLKPSTVQKRRSKGTINRNRLTCEFVKIKQSYSYIMPVYKCMYNFPQLTEVWFNKTSCTLPVTLEMEKINNALLLMYPSYLFTENTLRHFRDPGLNLGGACLKTPPYLERHRRSIFSTHPFTLKISCYAPSFKEEFSLSKKSE